MSGIFNPPANVPFANDFRLSLVSATPVGDASAATTLYWTPTTGNRITLFDASGNPMPLTSPELSIAVPATTSTVYDVFVFENSGVRALELLAWTNDTTRATALVRTNGRLTKSGDSTRLYVGSFRTTTVSGQTEDSATKRFVSNYYNRVRRGLHRHEATNTWTYTTLVLRQANAAAANQVEVLVGVDALLELEVSVFVQNSTGGVIVTIGIGEDSTSTALSGVTGGDLQATTNYAQVRVSLRKQVAIGRHFYAWLEESNATGTTSWGAIFNTAGSGINGSIDA
jgi:hypothetical protein